MSIRYVAGAKWLTLAAGALLGCVGCMGTETGNPSETREVSVALVLKSSNGDIARSCADDCEEASIGLRITSAWLSTRDLDVQSCVGSDESDVPASVWDLLHPTARRIQTAVSTYCGFALQTWPADASLGAAPSELSGSSIWLSALRPDNTVVDIRSPVVLDIARPDSSPPITDSKLVIVLDAAAWFAGIDFNALQPSADAIVHVDATSNPVQLRVIEQQTSVQILLRKEESDDSVLDE